MSEITVGAGLVAVSNVLKPVVERGLSFLGKLCGPAAKVAGEMLEDRMYGWRVAQAAKIASMCKDELDKAGIQPRELPTHFLLPFLEAAGVVGDEELQVMWARLMASAVADDAAQHPAFRHILGEINADEGRIIAWLTDVSSVSLTTFVSKQATQVSDAPMFVSPSLVLRQPGAVEFYSSNLQRLKIIRGFIQHRPETSIDGVLAPEGHNVAQLTILLTDLGKQLAALTLKGPRRPVAG